jgi:halocyanin-like protein
MSRHQLARRQVLRAAGATTAALAGVSEVPQAAAGGPGGDRVGATQAADGPGERIWSVETGGAVESEPTVVGGTVYVGSHDGYVYALDAESGEEQWRFETGAPPDDQRKADAGVWGAPHVVDGTAYVGANDNHLYALDAETGEKRWRVDTGRFVWGSPTLVDGTLYGASRSHLVFALDPETGEPEWTYRAEGPVGSAPTVVDGRVHFASYLDVNMTTLDAATGEHMWDKEFTSELCAPPAYHDGTVFTGFVDRPLYAFDAETGEEEWRFGDDFSIKNPPTFWEGTVYQADYDALYAVDADTGTLEWKYGGDARPRRNAPTVAGGVLFVGTSRETNLLALDPDTGEELGRFEVYGSVRGSPTVVDGTVFFGADDGYVHAVEAGVEGSSEDSRFRQGVTGHHHGWVGAPEPDLEMVADGEAYVRADEPFELPYGDWFDGVENYDGTADRRGNDEIRVTVGAGDEGLLFDPPAVIVDPGTKVTFRWTGEGGTHNVVEENGVWASDLTDESGHEFPLDWSTLGRADLSEHGVYRYYCEPHRGQGMRGAVVVGDVEAAVDDVEEEPLGVTGPGPGPLGALAGIGTAGYLLARRLRED